MVVSGMLNFSRSRPTWSRLSKIGCKTRKKLVVKLSSKWTTSIVNRQLEPQVPLGPNRTQERRICRDQPELVVNNAVLHIIVRGSQDRLHHKEAYRDEEEELDRDGESEAGA